MTQPLRRNDPPDNGPRYGKPTLGLPDGRLVYREPPLQLPSGAFADKCRPSWGMTMRCIVVCDSQTRPMHCNGMAKYGYGWHHSITIPAPRVNQLGRYALILVGMMLALRMRWWL